MKKDERQQGGTEQAGGSREPQRAHPTPGKVTRSSRLSNERAPAVQRKPAATGAPSQARSAWSHTMDPWMDAAHRGLTALAETRQDPVQARGGLEQPADHVHQLARQGVSGAAASLPHRDQIQRSFGSHDVSGIQAHVGGAAVQATEGMGAEAYATGDQVAFRQAPDLHTAAHEAAHVVQQRAGVQLYGGVGQSGDAYERHADAVADLVVQGKSAEGLLDSMSGSGGQEAVQMLATHGGDFSTQTYDPYSSGAMRGATIELLFAPNELVESPKIGLTQTARAMDGGAPTYIGSDEREERGNTAAEGDEGRHIDRVGGRTSPFYGVNNDGTPSGTARFGKRVVDRATGAVDAQDAYLYDQPKLSWSAGVEQSVQFEAAAISMEGEQAGTYYGTVSWGARTDAAGNVALDPLQVVSMGTPTAEFMTSAEHWNDQEVDIGGTATATDDLPITSHRTVDPATLDDRALEQRMRALCDEIQSMDRTTPDYQNKRFEIRALAREAVRRAGEAGEVIDSGHTLTVGRGDTLWQLAATHLGGGARWTRIFMLNYLELGDPNRVFAGATLRMPQPYEP
jgi:nucleoid-associated protein YgaU